MSAMWDEVNRRLRGLRGMVEFVTDIVVGSDGKFTALGAKTDDDDGNQLQGDTGWHFGFQSRPLDGCTGAVVKPGGKGGAAFLFCWRNREYEISLQKGEVVIYNEAGAYMKLDKDGNEYLVPGGGEHKVYVGAASSTQPGVLGNTLQTRLADLESKFIAHTHDFAGATASSCTAGGSAGTCSGTSSATASTLPHSGDDIKCTKVEVQ